MPVNQLGRLQRGVGSQGKPRILSDMFSMTPELDIVSHFQYKVFAILFSSFEDVFFLDSDSFPVINPDPVMTIDPFKSLGLVTWPDMWAQTSSHVFFDIAGIPTPPVNKWSTEAGQLMYSKRKHGASLLLATYYNYYGPDYYYRLQSQNAWGQGDKETFLHAALALQMPFYDVKSPTWNVGQWVANDNFRHVGMAQYHPGDDYSLSQGQVQAGHKIRPFLMHNNYPLKLDPGSIMDDGGPTKAENGSYWRLWGTKEDIVESFGYDAEKAMWEELMLRACEIDKNCDKIKAYYKAVFVDEERRERDTNTSAKEKEKEREKEGKEKWETELKVAQSYEWDDKKQAEYEEAQKKKAEEENKSGSKLLVDTSSKRQLGTRRESRKASERRHRCMLKVGIEDVKMGIHYK